MPHRRLVDQHREAIIALSAGHFVVAILDVYGRARFTIDARSELLQALADNPLWTVAHALAVVALITLVTVKKCRSWLMNYAAAVMSTWSGVMLAWALTAHSPVSLVGPFLGIILAVVTLALSRSMAPDDD